MATAAPPNIPSPEQIEFLGAEKEAYFQEALNQHREVVPEGSDPNAHNQLANELNDQKIRNNQIESRLNNEVPALNDRAELEIYGSKGRTYRDPETGDLIADKDHLLTGKIDEIRGDGKTRPKNNQEAKKYEDDLETLLGDGYELCQAKLIMDLRGVDSMFNQAKADHVLRMTGKLVGQGSDQKIAQTRAEKYFDAKYSHHKDIPDNERLKLIKEKGIFTPSDYMKVRGGQDLYPKPGPNYIVPNVAPPEPIQPNGPIDPAEQKARQILRDPKFANPKLENGDDNPNYNPEITELAYATNDLTDLAAKRERGTITVDASQEKLEILQNRYETLRQEVNKFLQAELQREGYNNKQIDQAILKQDLGETRLLPRAVANNAERLAKENRFVNWWVKQKGFIGMLKKAGVMAPAGIIAGAALAPVAGIGIGAGAALMPPSSRTRWLRC